MRYSPTCRDSLHSDLTEGQMADQIECHFTWNSSPMKRHFKKVKGFLLSCGDAIGNDIFNIHRAPFEIEMEMKDQIQWETQYVGVFQYFNRRLEWNQNKTYKSLYYEQQATSTKKDVVAFKSSSNTNPFNWKSISKFCLTST
jgi:hypothetical protein